ncbi:MAG: accessory gene regulator B family protein [Mycoplasmatota bacterium]
MNEKDKVIIAKLLLKITFIMIVISVGFKMLGFNWFDADYSNKILVGFSNFINNYRFYQSRAIINFILLFIQSFIFFKLSCKNKNKKIYVISSFMLITIALIFQILLTDFVYPTNENLANLLYSIFSLISHISIAMLIDIKQDYKNKNFLKNLFNRIKKPLLITILIMIYQLVAMFLRNLTPSSSYDILYNFLLNFDYTILLIVTYYVHMRKKNNLKIKNVFDFELIKLLNYKLDKNQLSLFIENFKVNYKKFKELDKTNKIVAILYITFFIIQELMTLSLLIFIALINNYIIECLFIVIAFLISKQVFGAFHFKSFILCFFVSNTTFFVLSKLTMDVSSTFVIPILCGIMLSYIASRFIKEKDITPYRGIPKEDLDKICKEKKLNKMETNILIDYYSNRDNLNKIAIKYNYSDRSIQRIKLKALQKIEV